MHTVSVEIVRFVDPAFPGWIECVLRDASSREWFLEDKVPVFTGALLDAASSYPQPGVVACEMVRDWTGHDGRKRCIITTERPCGVATKDGETQFEVFHDQLTIQVA